MTDTWRAAALLAGVALAAAALAACGGDDETEPSPTSVPTAATSEERDAAGPILMASALLAEDLPEGFTLDEEKYLTNEDSIDEERDYAAAATLEDLNRWGQILQYIATYSRATPPIAHGRHSVPERDHRPLPRRGRGARRVRVRADASIQP